MKVKIKPHWLSFVQDALPFLKEFTGIDWTGLYWESLAQYKELDYYHFQHLPFVNAIDEFRHKLRTAGVGERQLSSQAHVLQEEAYAVLSFHKYDCRVIRLTVDAVQAFKHTNVNVPLTDIAPPYPHVYIALPKGQGLQLKNSRNQSEMIDLQGMYVTWERTGQATRDAIEVSKTQKFKRNQWGLIVDASRAEESDPFVEASAEMFGDWACRVQAVAWAGDNYKHNYTTTFFNMRWLDDNKEEAEGAYERFAKLWIISFEKCPGGQMCGMEVNQQLFHLIANTYLYMSQKGDEADSIWVPNEDRERLRTGKGSMNSKRRRKLKKQLLEEMPTDEWIVGQKLKIDKSIESVDTDEQPGTGKHASPKTHWRRGHWHGYWTGSREGERKLVYKLLRPVLIFGVGSKPDYTVISVEKSK